MYNDDNTTALLIQNLFTWLAIQEHRLDHDADDIDLDGLDARLQTILAAMDQRAETAQASTDLQHIYAVLDRINTKIVARNQEATASMQRLSHSTNSIARYVQTARFHKM